MGDVMVQAQRLPGIGWRYSVPTTLNRQLMIVVEDRGPRHLVIVDPSLDASLMTMRLSETDAGVVAALLRGCGSISRSPRTSGAAHPRRPSSGC
jgi:K+/H+ antiporter YhaU regulatory subunit KhtT